MAVDQVTEKRFPCGQCGAKLVFSPGVAKLRCEYCGFENEIPQSDADIKELDFRQYLAELAKGEQTVEQQQVKCSACAAEFEPPADATAFACPFCGADIVTPPTATTIIKPKSLLPFKVTREQAWGSFRKWLKGLWFAPSKLKRFARIDSRLSGMYVPHWTYDANTISHYTGQRGDDYWVTESYTTRQNGKTVHKTRRVRKTRWTYVSGTVWNSFDDVLVLASRSLPQKHAEQLEPWDLKNLVPYGDEYLSGFQAQRYQVDLAQGFERAKDIMDGTIRMTICRDIGGDHQRIHSVRTQHNDVKFKHILLPVWISAYRFKEKVYRFLVNARTGEVQGERPWSWIKITLAALGGLILVGAGVWVYVRYLS